jgi:hypothetical protein
MIIYIVPQCGNRYRSLWIGAIKKARYSDDSSKTAVCGKELCDIKDDAKSVEV